MDDILETFSNVGFDDNITWDLVAGDGRLGVTLGLAGGGLPPVHVLLLEAPLPAALAPALPDEVLDPGPGPGVHHVAPVSARADRKLLEPLDQQHARVADLALSRLGQVKTFPEVVLVLGT